MTLLRRALRSLVIAGLVACAALIGPSPAAADDGCSGGTLEVTTLPASAIRCFTWQDLSDNQDVSGKTYDPGDIKVLAGISMHNLLFTVLGLQHVSTTVVRGTGDTASRLSDATDDFEQDYENTFQDGPPVFFSQDKGATISYIKPRRKTGAREEVVGVTEEEALHLVVRTEGVRIRPSLTGPTRPSPGREVSYRSEVDDPDTGETLTVTIEFGDGPPPPPVTIGRSGDRTFLHTFTKAGTYLVEVRVSGDAGSGGSAHLTVTVPGRKPPPPSSPPATSGPSNGAGGRDAPVYAPPTGSGPEPTGTTAAPTDARGTSERGAAERSGPAGATPGRSGAAGRAATSGAALPAGVRVAGFALPAPGTVAQERSGRRPAAPAARSSVTHTAFPTWGVVSVTVAVGLALLGAVSERRRPSRRPRRAGS